MPMNTKQLIEQIKAKGSFLCVGLDSDIDKIPKKFLDTKHPQFEFNKAIIDATHQYTVAYKPNLAFYESRGWKGIQCLELTESYIRDNFPNIFCIADAKRGDIGNTSEMYAKAFFDHMSFDAVTVAPYMGEDSVTPFLHYPNKFIVVLALTSNKGSFNFQRKKIDTGAASWPLYAHVITEIRDNWKACTADNTMFVVGATNAADEIKFIRELVPNHFLLVPGIGVQGGSLEAVCEYGMNNNCGIIVNNSRAIIFASNGDDFAQRAGEEAKITAGEMSKQLYKKGIL